MTIGCIEEIRFPGNFNMGYMYILICRDGTFYTGSTIDLELRLSQHQIGEGSNYTKKRLPIFLVYYEEYPRIDEAFAREKQIQNWNHKKKMALINGELDRLPYLAKKVFRGRLDTITALSLGDRT